MSNQRTTIKTGIGRTLIIILGIILAVLITWSSKDLLVSEVVSPVQSVDLTIQMNNPIKEKLPEMVKFVVETVETQIK